MLSEDDLKEIGTAQDIYDSQHEMTFLLSPNYMMKQIKNVPFVNNKAKLAWKHVKYNTDIAKKKIPSGKKGIYAFVAMHKNDIFPNHGYIMYIGIAGKTKNPARGLNERYKDYITKSKITRRGLEVRKMLSFYHKILYFFYSEVDSSFTEEKLYDLETELIQSLMPPVNKNKKKRNQKYNYPDRIKASGKKPEKAF